MRCDVHCPPPGSALRGPLLALGGLAGLCVAAYVARLLAGWLVAAVVVVYVVAVGGGWSWVRLMRYGHVWRRAKQAKEVTSLSSLRPALPAPLLAIEGPVPAAVVLDVRDGERLDV